jgi:hypothetical protein
MRYFLQKLSYKKIRLGKAVVEFNTAYLPFESPFEVPRFDSAKTFLKKDTVQLSFHPFRTENAGRII